MKLLESKKFKLPLIYFVSDKNKIKEIPIGVPYIFGDENVKDSLIRIFEYEVLYQNAIKSGYPFNFKKILKDNGFLDLEDFWYSKPIYIDFKTKLKKEEETEYIFTNVDLLTNNKYTFKKFIKDSSVYVNIEKLKDLNVFPIWLDKIEDAINTNIHNFTVYNNNMYNKKLEGMYGSLDLTAPNRNIIIIDISGSIPKGVSATCLALAKNLSESFYADILITGSKSTLYLYEEIYKLDINTIYEENGMDNDQTHFKKLVSSEKKIYKTAIVFGDNHSPCYAWKNSYNKNTKEISREDGKNICIWEIEKLISFHTSSITKIAGYADWFTVKETEKISDWVKYLV